MRRKLKRAVSSSRWKMWINVRRTAQYVAVRSSFNSEHQTSWLTRGRGEPACGEDRGERARQQPHQPTHA